jgi:hypothetical protein
MSSPSAAPARPEAAAPPVKTLGKAAADGTTVFRRPGPVIFFWVWVAFVIFNIVQVVIPDHDYFSVELAVALLGSTGLAYACGLRPRVIANDESVLVRNPLRDHLIRWGALGGVRLGESVEFACSRPEPKKDKTIYCWALYTGRSARRRMRSSSGIGPFGSMRGQRPRPGSDRLPAEAVELQVKDQVELMTGELASRLEQARQRGVPAAVLESRTAWISVASIVGPAVAFAALLLAR